MNQRQPNWNRFMWIALAILATALIVGCGDDSAPPTPGPAATPTPMSADTPDGPDSTAASGDGNGAPVSLNVVLAAEDARSAAYNPDGSQVAVSSDTSIWLYPADLRADDPLALRGHEESVTALAWSPDGLQLASASQDQTVRIWDAASGDTVATLDGHADWVMDVAWSPDGAQVASASSDGTLRLWDAATGNELAQLGRHRVVSIELQFRTGDAFDVLAELNYARTILDMLEAEPLHELIEAVHVAGYTIAVEFEDPAQVDLLLALHDEPVRVQITTSDEDLNAELAALSDAERRDLVLALDAPSTAETLEDLNQADATIAAIYRRDDADLIRTVDRLQNETLVLTVENADGETTTLAPSDGDLVASVADLDLDDLDAANLSFGIENEAAIVERLQDPDFLDAVQRLDAAQTTVAEITRREDAAHLLRVRRVLAADYTVTLTTSDDFLDTALAKLDTAARIDILRLLDNADLLATLARLAAADNVVTELDDPDLSAIVAALDPLAFDVRVQVDDAELAERIASLEPAEVLRLADLLDDRVLLYAIAKADEAGQIVADVQARDDLVLLNVLQQLEGPRTMETIISASTDSNEIRVSRKRNEADYMLSFPLVDDTAILAQSALSDETLADQFAAQSTDELIAAIETEVYDVVPALSTEELGAMMEAVREDNVVIRVQREANAHEGSVTAAAWSPETTAGPAYLASTGVDLTLRLWAPDTRQLAATLDIDETGTTLAWSPDGSLLLSADWSDDTVLWDVNGGGTSASERDTLSAHDERVTAAAWSPDGTRLATAGRGGLMVVWDVATGDALAEIAAHAGDIRAVTWSPNGSQIVTASLDGTVKLWDVAAALDDGSAD